MVAGVVLGDEQALPEPLRNRFRASGLYHLLRALRLHDPRASLAHLAYLNSLEPPKKVRPESGVFLEYAPIRRRYDTPRFAPANPMAGHGAAW